MNYEVMTILVLNALILVINESNMSEAIIWVVWVVSGVVITFLTQIFYYHWIEKYKLQKEREFSFRKEEFFNLQEKVEILYENTNIINSYVLNHKNWSFKDILSQMAQIEGIINTYLPELKVEYEKYMTIISESFGSPPSMTPSKQYATFANSIKNQLIAIRSTLTI